MGDRRIAVLVGAALASLFLIAAPMGEPGPARAAGCIELVQNGGFEADTAWLIGSNAYPAAYSSARAHSGARAMRLGLDGAPNRVSYSSIRQPISIPATAAAAYLTFWAYPISEASGEGDRQEAILLYPDGSTAAIIWRTLSNSQTWTPFSFNLAAFAGQTFILYFNVYNDGVGGRAALYLDDVSLQVCEGVTPTPTAIVVTATPTPGPPTIVVTNTPTPIIVTATPTPSPPLIVVTNTPTPVVVTATPTPAGACTELLTDGGFESFGTGWTRGKTPQYAVLVGPPLTHSGNVAVRLGPVGQPDKFSYSSIRQTVSLPYGVQAIRLSFWHYLQSEDVGTERDRQEALLLDPVTSIPLSILWRVTRDDRAWLQETLDLTPFQGQIVVLYFNVRNDGDGRRSAMYLDDVSLLACYAPTPPSFSAAPTLPPEGTPEAVAVLPEETTPTPTPSPTPFVTPIAAAPASPAWNAPSPLDEALNNLPMVGAGALFVGATAALAAFMLLSRRESRE
jgi:hypothetical protein